MEYREKRKSVIFTYRFENALEEAIDRELLKRHSTFGPKARRELILEAFQAFADAYNSGKIDPGVKSDFRRRGALDDKVTRKLSFPIKPKLTLARMAFTFILSQAEVLRRALEWYIRGICQGEKFYLMKMDHDPDYSFIRSIAYNLYDQFIDATKEKSPDTGPGWI